jgi:large subunit ribosomal protein L24
MKIKTGDKVLIIKGKDKGKSGKVVSADHINHTIKVSGINIVKRHTKAGKNKAGGVVEVAAPVKLSNVMFLCPHCGDKPTRLGYTLAKDGKKERICKKCKATV